MTVYNAGDKVKVKETTGTSGVMLEKGMEGIVVTAPPGRVEAAFEGLGLVAVDLALIKKKVRKIEKLVKAKNLKLSDEVYLPGTGEYNKLANIYRSDYDSNDPTISVETVCYDSKDFEYNDLVEVRR